MVRIKVRDFRVLREADVSIQPGIYLVRADNDSGKSTLLKAVRSLLDGTAGDSVNPRHGTTSFSVRVDVDGSSAEVRRSGKTTSYVLDDGPPLSKVGKKPLCQLAPDFPMRRVETESAVFYPNFCFQNSVPLFREVSVLDLFASMFSDVSKLSDCVDSAREREVACRRELERHAVRLDSARADVAARREELETHMVSSPAPALTRELVEELRFLKRSCPDGFRARMDLLASRPDILGAVKPYRVYKEMFPHVYRLSSELLAVPEPVDVSLFEAVSRLASADSSVASSCDVPEPVDIPLFEAVLRYVSSERELSSLQSMLDYARSALDDLRSRHGEILSNAGCPALLSGSCPLVGLSMNGLHT